MKSVGYYNGSFGALVDMYIPINDRGCYFGDGIYEASYGRNGIVYALDEHIDRFFRSAGIIGLNLTFTPKVLEEIIYSAVAKTELKEFFVYWQATRGTAERNHSYPDGMAANLWVIVKERKMRPKGDKMRLITVEDTRGLWCHIKNLNLLPNVLASKEAAKKGADEAVFIRDGIVTECAHSNISILKGGKLITASESRYILAGTGRAHLIALCKKLGIPVEERPYGKDELLGADEVIVTSAGAPCSGVIEIDGMAVGGKASDVLKKLQETLYKDFFEKTGG
ncbi:MAG: D-amino acid aminotransferase [Clostridiales bacterium]|nr:D-amino acid aminotransferase [Clostridiales bacterium]HOB64826.1 aminotransferase class IV [Clostridia bacterium]HOK81925.1 aminotransferase class IV [Clostridia bacterium]HOL61261.1 aminotransferase class IV [Clostridia bacterium]HPO53939.1 aminotransferase class IV [Clostridia bacterium]